MKLVLSRKSQKIIASFCLLIYVMFNFLGNAGAMLCFGTNVNKHIGIHALGFDSCPDGNICNFLKSRSTFSDSKNNFNYGHFQMNLNKVLLFFADTSLNLKIHSCFCYCPNLFEEKYNKINWDIYENFKIPPHLAKLETIILII